MVNGNFMNKRAFTIIEVVMVFLLILGVTFFMMPLNIQTTKQAQFISQWNEKYSQLQYMFSVIIAQKDGEIKEKFAEANNDEDRKNIVLNAIKPYLRITSEVKTPYKQLYMNKSAGALLKVYDFNNFYYTSSGEIVGLKLINPNCDKDTVCAVINFDLNGEKTPNEWGRDIFGINVLKDSIEPLGKNLSPDVLKYDCSKKGSGVYCSYYYLIGGRFD